MSVSRTIDYVFCSLGYKSNTKQLFQFYFGSFFVNFCLWHAFYSLSGIIVLARSCCKLVKRMKYLSSVIAAQVFTIKNDKVTDFFAIFLLDWGSFILIPWFALFTHDYWILLFFSAFIEMTTYFFNYWLSSQYFLLIFECHNSLIPENVCPVLSSYIADSISIENLHVCSWSIL